MEFVATYWLVWLGLFLGSLSVLIFIQMRTIKTMKFPSPFVFSFLAFVANGSMVLLIIGIVINIIKCMQME